MQPATAGDIGQHFESPLLEPMGGQEHIKSAGYKKAQEDLEADKGYLGDDSPWIIDKERVVQAIQKENMERPYGIRNYTS